MKTEGGDLSCKPENCLNVHERVEMIERNEDGPLNSFIAQIVLKLLSSEVVFFSKEANQTIEFPLLEVMTIPHIFIKNL